MGAAGQDGGLSPRDAAALARIERGMQAWSCHDARGPSVAFAFPGKGRDGRACLRLELLAERAGRPLAIALDGHPRDEPGALLERAWMELGDGNDAVAAGLARQIRRQDVASRFGRALATGIFHHVSHPETGWKAAPASLDEAPLERAIARSSGAALQAAVAEAGFSRAFLDGLVLLHTGPYQDAAWTRMLFVPDSRGDRLRALARDYPFLSWIAPYLREAVALLREGASPAAGLFPYAPNPEALMRRFRGAGSGRGMRPDSFGIKPAAIAAGLRFVSELPLDWIRPDEGELVTLAGLAHDLPDCARVLRTSPLALLASCAGDFGAFLDRCGGSGDGYRRASLYDRARDARDGANDLARRILAPLVARSVVETGIGSGDELAIAGRADDLAHALLHARRGLPSILERSTRWHRLLPAINARMPHANAPEASWEPLCPPFRLGAVEVRALVSAGELADEGADAPDASGVPGLAHCVAGYAKSCLRGSVDILSVRRIGRGTLPYERLSTVEIGWDEFGPEAEPRVVQHRGRRNGPPAAEAERALAAFLERGGLVRRAPSPAAEPSDAVAEACGYDWTDDVLMEAAIAAYAPAMPASLRGLDARALSERLGIPVPVLEACAAPR